MKFSYLATTPDRQSIKGTISAANFKQGRELLEKKGYQVVKMEQVKGLASMEINMGHLKSQDVLLFAKNLMVMLKAGIAIVEAMGMVREQSKGKLQNIVTEMLGEMQAGFHLSDAMEKHPRDFPNLIVQLIRSGELSGTLEENLDYIVFFMKREMDMRKKVKGAMMYPVIIFLAIIGLILVVGLFVMPQVTPLFDTLGLELPFTTKVLIWVSDTLKNYGFVLVPAMLSLGFIVPLFLESKWIRPISHRAYLLVPGFGTIVRYVFLARFFRVFATLLNAGIAIDQALRIMENVIRNVPYKKSIHEMEKIVVKGEMISSLMKRNKFLYPTTASHMLYVGEKSGKLVGSLDYLAGYYEEEVDDRLSNIATLIEPVMLVGIGLLVAVVAFSIIGPIYSISGGI